MKGLDQGERQGRGDHRVGRIFRRWSEEQHPAGAGVNTQISRRCSDHFHSRPTTQIAAAPAPAKHLQEPARLGTQVNVQQSSKS